MPLRTRVARLAASADFGDHRFDRIMNPYTGAVAAKISCLKAPQRQA